jgi:hypothetical protein
MRSSQSTTSQQIQEETKKTQVDDALTSKMNEFMNAITKSVDSMAAKVDESTKTTKKILDIVTYIQKRVAPRDVTLGPKEEGGKTKTIRYDPLAPAGKQYSEVGKSGKSIGWAEDSYAKRAELSFSRTMPNDEQTTQTATQDDNTNSPETNPDDYSQETAQEEKATKIDIPKEEEKKCECDDEKEEDKGSGLIGKLLAAIPLLLAKFITPLMNVLGNVLGIATDILLGMGKVVAWIASGIWSGLKKVLEKVASYFGISLGDDAAKAAAKKAAAEAAKKAAAKKAAAEAAKKAGKETAETVGKETAETVGKGAAKVTTEVGEAAVEDAAKSAAKTVGKDVGKEVVEKTVKTSVASMLAKKIPYIGAAVGLGIGAWTLLTKGDATGAALEAASGLTSLAPGPGTFLGLGIDAGIIARDISRDLGIPPEEALKMVKDEIEKQLGNVEKVNDKIEGKIPPDQEPVPGKIPENALGVPKDSTSSFTAPATENRTTGEDLDVRSSDLAQKRTVPVAMQPIILSQKSATPQVVSIEKETGKNVIIKTRHLEPSLATYRASVFDHPMTHPGNYML